MECSTWVLVLYAMVHYCCVYDCKNNSFHGFPKDKKLVKVRNIATINLNVSASQTIPQFVYSVRSASSIMYFIFVVAFKVWITRIKRDPKKDFKVTESMKVCSEHFTPEDFMVPVLLCFRGLPKRKKGPYL